MQIGNRIKSLRMQSNMTQKDLALKIGLTPKMISFYENSERIPPMDIVIKFVEIFNVSSDYLLGLTSAPDAKEIIHGEVLTKDEKKLIETYRSLDSDEKLAILGKAIDFKLNSASPNKKKDIG
ncbi:MAG: helix-turn-helix transcriptional regulator [Lachnospiraceae bacterium]|nr:helix-turn-helix transcriptional regulator [Lachnospiraceae bacterium]